MEVITSETGLSELLLCDKMAEKHRLPVVAESALSGSAHLSQGLCERNRPDVWSWDGLGTVTVQPQHSVDNLGILESRPYLVTAPILGSRSLKQHLSPQAPER